MAGVRAVSPHFDDRQVEEEKKSDKMREEFRREFGRGGRARNGRRR